MPICQSGLGTCNCFQNATRWDFQARFTLPEGAEAENPSVVVSDLINMDVAEAADIDRATLRRQEESTGVGASVRYGPQFVKFRRPVFVGSLITVTVQQTAVAGFGEFFTTQMTPTEQGIFGVADDLGPSFNTSLRGCIANGKTNPNLTAINSSMVAPGVDLAELKTSPYYPEGSDGTRAYEFTMGDTARMGGYWTSLILACGVFNGYYHSASEAGAARLAFLRKNIFPPGTSILAKGRVSRP